MRVAPIGASLTIVACRRQVWAEMGVGRTPHGAMAMRPRESHRSKFALRMLENQLKSLLRAIFSPPAAPAAGSIF